MRSWICSTNIGTRSDMEKSKVHSGCIVSRSSAVRFSKLDDEMLAIDEQAECCYALNGTAGRVWELIQNPASIGDICARLGEEFVVDEATCIQEVLQLLENLQEAGLVKITDRHS